MSEYRDSHNNVYKIIERSIAPQNEEEREMNRDVILDELFNIFAPAKFAAGVKES